MFLLQLVSIALCHFFTVSFPPFLCIKNRSHNVNDWLYVLFNLDYMVSVFFQSFALIVKTNFDLKPVERPVYTLKLETKIFLTH